MIPNTSILTHILEPLDDADPFNAHNNDLVKIPILAWGFNEKTTAYTLNGPTATFVAATADDIRYNVIDGQLKAIN
jgi:hypothetical protein